MSYIICISYNIDILFLPVCRYLTFYSSFNGFILWPPCHGEIFTMDASALEELEQILHDAVSQLRNAKLVFLYRRSCF